MSNYEQGTVVRVKATFTDAAGAPVDPTTVKVLYQPGGGAQSVVTYGSGAIVRESTGVYHIDLDTSVTTHYPSTWQGRWISSGTGQAARPFSFQVTPPNL